MIVEIIGPPASGKTTMINRLKKSENSEIVFQEDLKTRKVMDILNIFNLLIIFSIYIKIFSIRKFNTTDKAFYARHISKKIIFMKKSIAAKKIFIPDEGLVHIYLSILSIYNISIYKIIDKYLEKYDYCIIFLDIELNVAQDRINKRGLPEGWRERNIFNNQESKEGRVLEIQKNYLKVSNDFIDEENKSYKKIKVNNNSNVDKAFLDINRIIKTLKQG